MSSAAANTAVDIGRQLAQVRAALEHGQWLGKLDVDLDEQGPLGAQRLDVGRPEPPPAAPGNLPRTAA